MKIQKIIEFTGKNLDDVFSLPCVKCILKVDGEPLLVLYSNVMHNSNNICKKGDRLVQFTTGSWSVE